MTIVLLFSLLIFLSILIKNTLFPLWLGDPVFVVVYFWSLFYFINKEKYKFEFWIFWIPIALGFRLANFTLSSKWIALSYVILALLLLALITFRSKWVFRFKEGFFAFLAIFLAFMVFQFSAKKFFLGYDLKLLQAVSFSVTFLEGFAIWFWLVKKENIGKIR